MTKSDNYNIGSNTLSKSMVEFLKLKTAFSFSMVSMLTLISYKDAIPLLVYSTASRLSLIIEEFMHSGT